MRCVSGWGKPHTAELAHLLLCPDRQTCLPEARYLSTLSLYHQEMKSHEIRTRAAEPRTDEGGTRVTPVLPVRNASTDPYWGAKQNGRSSQESPFTQSLRHFAGKRVSTQTTPSLGQSPDGVTGQTRDFFDLIEEAATRACAYCGSDEPLKGSCHFCSEEGKNKLITVTATPEVAVTPIHKAGDVLETSHVFIVEPTGETRKHYVARDYTRTTIHLGEGEIEI